MAAFVINCAALQCKTGRGALGVLGKCGWVGSSLDPVVVFLALLLLCCCRGWGSLRMYGRM